MIFDQVYSLKKGSILKPNGNKKLIQPPRAILALTFDDGFDTDYTIGYPAMLSRGIKGTSFLNTNTVGTPGYLTWTQIHEMRANGWDFQCHTHTHRRLTDLTEAEIRLEMENVNQGFVDNGLPTPRHHAYPFGLTSDAIRLIIEEYRDSQRATGVDESHLNDYKTAVASRLKGVSVDTQDDERFELVKRVINNGTNNGKAIVLYTHKIHPTAGAYPYQTVESYFLGILNHITSAGVETVTISELYDRVFVTT